MSLDIDEEVDPEAPRDVHLEDVTAIELGGALGGREDFDHFFRVYRKR